MESNIAKVGIIMDESLENLYYEHNSGILSAEQERDFDEAHLCIAKHMRELRAALTKQQLSLVVGIINLKDYMSGVEAEAAFAAGLRLGSGMMADDVPYRK